MKRFASSPRQLVERVKRGWRTRRGRIVLVYVASGTLIVALMFAAMILIAWGHRRSVTVVFILQALAFATYYFGGYRPAKRYRRRRDGGLCVNCGYDLRAATGHVCAECGSYNPKRTR